MENRQTVNIEEELAELTPGTEFFKPEKKNNVYNIVILTPLKKFPKSFTDKNDQIVNKMMMEADICVTGGQYTEPTNCIWQFDYNSSLNSLCGQIIVFCHINKPYTGVPMTLQIKYSNKRDYTINEVFDKIEEIKKKLHSQHQVKNESIEMSK